MHLTLAEAGALVGPLRTDCDVDGVDVVVCPPCTALTTVVRALAGSRIGVGAQDVHWEPQGALTGEISPTMLVDIGCRYVIIGHSERRTLFGETDETVRRKLGAAVQHGLIAIVCIGETLAQREANQTFEVLERQLAGGLQDVSADTVQQVVLAYEPVWAIGTGRNATPDQAQEAHAKIRQWVGGRWGALVAQAIRIQYGGSVTAANAASLLQQPDVDGALVGGASLKADAFTAIVQAGQSRRAAARTAAGR